MAASSAQMNGDEKHSSDPESSCKNILITGGAGFIGSNTTIHLVTKYPSYNFIVVDKLGYAANVKNLSSISNAKNFKFIRGSVTSKELMRRIFREHRINTVIHFAAETHVDLSFDNAFTFTENNVLGTHILLECAKRALFEAQARSGSGSGPPAQHGFDLFIHVSTDEVYGESKMDDSFESAFKEDARFQPTNPYSASKAAAEMIVHSYSKSFKLPVIVTRSSNIYGPRQFPEKMIPKFIELIHSGKPVCIYGDGKNTRVYVHVDDISNAFDTILHRGVIGEVYNITSDTELNTVEVVNRMLKCFDDIDPKEYSKYIAFVKDRPFHDSRYYINGEKMKALGWTPKIQFEDGLKQTVDWYLQHRDHWKNLEEVLVAHPTVHHETNKYGGDATEIEDEGKQDQ